MSSTRHPGPNRDWVRTVTDLGIRRRSSRRWPCQCHHMVTTPTKVRHAYDLCLAATAAHQGSTLHISNMWQLQCHCMSVHAHRCESPPLFWHAASPMGLVPGGASSLPSCTTCLDSAFEGLCPLVGPRAMCPECSLHVGYTILLLQSLLHVCMAIMASAPDPWSRAML